MLCFAPTYQSKHRTCKYLYPPYYLRSLASKAYRLKFQHISAKIGKPKKCKWLVNPPTVASLWVHHWPLPGKLGSYCLRLTCMFLLVLVFEVLMFSSMLDSALKLVRTYKWARVSWLVRLWGDCHAMGTRHQGSGSWLGGCCCILSIFFLLT